MKRRLSLYQWGVLKGHNGTISDYMVLVLLVIHSLSPGVSGQVALAALVALIALAIYHLTIHTRDPPHSSPLESTRFYAETVRPGSHPGHGTTCSGYKHFTLIDEKTSLPLSINGADKATTAPYQTIWCSYFSLFIHFPRVSPAR